MPAPPRRGEDEPAAFGPTDAVDPNRLVPGARAYRYTEAAPAGQLDVIAPCSGRIARLRGDWSHAHHLVLCTHCRLVYDVWVLDEGDGGFRAEFIVRDELPVLVHRRTRGWLAGQHPHTPRTTTDITAP